MIDFNRPAFTGREFDYIRDAVQRGMLCGDGEYTKRCSQWMMDKFHVNHVMLTTSCTMLWRWQPIFATLSPVMR